MCIRDSKCNKISSYLETSEEEISSGESLKILGFNFNSDPSAVYHVTGVINKFHTKLWTLRFLRKSGMDTENLMRVYNTVILPSVEYCSEIYHPLIPQYISAKLEQVQKRAMKLIHGWHVDYAKLIETGVVQTLEERRNQACIRFANKAVVSENFGRKWFPRNNSERTARESTRRPYLEKQARTNRMQNSPIQNMVRLLNEQSSK